MAAFMHEVETTIEKNCDRYLSRSLTDDRSMNFFL